MKYFRSLLSLLLVVVTIFLVSCGSPNQTKIPTTYSPEKIAQLQIYVQPIESARESLSELEELIAAKNWVDTITFIHGPLGQLRQDMSSLSRSLLPKDQKKASQLAKEVFMDFEQIDAAAKVPSYSDAENRYRDAVRDFDAFLEIIPTVTDNA